MPTFAALLRGINVGGNTLRMERLRELCAELGGKDVQSYVQSGNLVFAAAGSAAQWSTALARQLASETRLPVTVIVRTAAEMAKVVAGSPFLKEKAIDPAKLHVTFLERAPPKTAHAALDALVAKAGTDRLLLSGTEIYLHCPGGYGRSKLANTALEKALGLRATTRNWNTVNKLLDLSAE
jgi:uncharacterized protein (DUF1697 family)